LFARPRVRELYPGSQLSRDLGVGLVVLRTNRDVFEAMLFEGPGVSPRIKFAPSSCHNPSPRTVWVESHDNVGCLFVRHPRLVDRCKFSMNFSRNFQGDPPSKDISFRLGERRREQAEGAARVDRPLVQGPLSPPRRPRPRPSARGCSGWPPGGSGSPAACCSARPSPAGGPPRSAPAPRPERACP